MSTFGKLQKIYDNKEVSEIIVDGYNDVYWEENGKIEESDSLFSNEGEVFEAIKGILSSVQRTVESIENGFADLRLNDGTRVAITTSPISINGPGLVIRKLSINNVSSKDIIDWGCISEEGWKICEVLMKKGKNVLLAGNAGSGKTTMANLLIQEIDPAWRVVTVEKVAELDTNNRKRTLRLETPNAKQGEMNDLLQKAGLLRADTLVINELMGAETFEATKLMREGYSVFATIMAEGVSDALKKCELFCLMGQLGIGVNEIKYHVASGVDAVIYQERMEDGTRRVTHIALVEGLNEAGQFELKTLLSFDEDSGAFFTTPEGKSFK